MDPISQLGMHKTGSPLETVVERPGLVSGNQTSSADFSHVLKSEKSSDSSTLPGDGKAAEVNRKLEAMLLSQFISEFIKHDAEAVFGDGVQGDFYKSLFSDAIAEQMSGRSILGFTKVA